MWKDVVRHLQGNIYEKRAVFKTTDTVITAIEIALTRNRDHTVAFFGTENGKVLKVCLKLYYTYVRNHHKLKF